MHTEVDPAVGELIVQLRNAVNMSQTELAQQIGVLPEALARIENAQVALTFDQFIQICAELELSPEYVMSIYSKM